VPIHFDFDPAHELLRARIEGPVDDKSIKEYYRLVGKHATRLLPHGGILDFSAVTSFEVSSETLRELASLMPAMPDPSRTRVIVAPSRLVYGLSRIFQAFGGDTRPKLHVVSTLEEAYGLLDVQTPQFRALEEAAPEDPTPDQQR
jgi:hypothetical protein